MDIRACDYHSRAVGDRSRCGFLIASLIARDVVVEAAVPLARLSPPRPRLAEDSFAPIPRRPNRDVLGPISAQSRFLTDDGLAPNGKTRTDQDIRRWPVPRSM
jgi:hypothetical protein